MFFLMVLDIYLFFTILLQNQVLWWEKASGKGKPYQDRSKSKITFKTIKNTYSKPIKNISHFPIHKNIPASH